ncbi:hypothetical protein WAI453_004326 [Rhynchosporium graminicola]
MYNPSQDEQQNIPVKKSPAQALRHWQTDNEADTVLWIDCISVDQEHTSGRWRGIAMMRKIYQQATSTMAWTSQEVDSRFRKVEFNRRTKKAMAFIFACVCAAQLTQRHSGEPETETIPIEKLRGNLPAHIGVSSRWPAIMQEKQPLDYGCQTTLLNVLIKRVSLVKYIHIPALLSRPHPHLLLLASLAFAFPITYLRYTNKGDKYQDEIIVGCILLLVMAASMIGGGIWEIAIPLLPWSIILGLILSWLIHRVFGLQGRRTGGESQAKETQKHSWLYEKSRELMPRSER